MYNEMAGLKNEQNGFSTSTLNKITPIVSACMSKESHFSFDSLGKEFASCLKFMQYARLSFSPSNLSAAFFGSTTFQLLLIFFHHLSLLKSILLLCM